MHFQFTKPNPKNLLDGIEHENNLRTCSRSPTKSHSNTVTSQINDLVPFESQTTSGIKFNDIPAKDMGSLPHKIKVDQSNDTNKQNDNPRKSQLFSIPNLTEPPIHSDKLFLSQSKTKIDMPK